MQCTDILTDWLLGAFVVGCWSLVESHMLADGITERFGLKGQSRRVTIDQVTLQVRDLATSNINEEGVFVLTGNLGSFDAATKELSLGADEASLKADPLFGVMDFCVMCPTSESLNIPQDEELSELSNSDVEVDDMQ